MTLEEYSIWLNKDMKEAEMKGINKFSDFLKSLTDEQVSKYYVILKMNEPFDDPEEEKLTIKKATLLYTVSMYYLEDKGNHTTRIDADSEWFYRIVSFLALDMVHRGGMLKNYEGFLKEGDITTEYPKDFEKMAIDFLGHIPGQNLEMK